jgi:hypothetical protein
MPRGNNVDTYGIFLIFLKLKCRKELCVQFSWKNCSQKINCSCNTIPIIIMKILSTHLDKTGLLSNASSNLISYLIIFYYGGLIKALCININNKISWKIFESENSIRSGTRHRKSTLTNRIK